jgi:DNA-binding SARP family transcriptional activator
MTVRLQTLGAVGARLPGEPSGEFLVPRPKPFALVAFLAVDLPERPRRRDSLLPLLWPELDAHHGRQALRQTLLELTHELGPSVVRRHGNESLSVDPGRLECDAVLFRAALSRKRPREALELYGGPFLDGFHLPGCAAFERWIDGLRDGLQREASDASWWVARRAHGRGDRSEAVRLARQAVDLAPYSERGWRRLMRLLDEYGDRALALEAYRRLEERLRRDLELEPSEETKTVAKRIAGQGAALEGPWHLDQREVPGRAAAGSRG